MAAGCLPKARPRALSLRRRLQLEGPRNAWTLAQFPASVFRFLRFIRNVLSVHARRLQVRGSGIKARFIPNFTLPQPAQVPAIHPADAELAFREPSAKC